MAKKDLIREYQELLLADETIENVDRVLRLIERASGFAFRWADGELELQKLRRAQEQYAQLFNALSEHIQDYEEEHFKKATQRRQQTRARIEFSQRVGKIALSLSLLPKQVEALPNPLPPADWSFFFDACVLLFHQAYLPFCPRQKAAIVPGC